MAKDIKTLQKRKEGHAAKHHISQNSYQLHMNSDTLLIVTRTCDILCYTHDESNIKFKEKYHIKSKQYPKIASIDFDLVTAINKVMNKINKHETNLGEENNKETALTIHAKLRKIFGWDK